LPCTGRSPRRTQRLNGEATKGTHGGARQGPRDGNGPDREAARQGCRHEDERQGEMSIETISTGALALDLALGVGGLPRGRVVEIFGPESSGKSTLAMHVVAEAQRNGGICAYIDAEHAMDPVYAKNI